MKSFDPKTCTEYKEYSKKWLPQDETLAFYEVDDFKEDPDSKKDTFDQLTEYLDTLQKYSKHLSMAAFLRQKHFETYILCKCIEEPNHTYWRIGLNRVAEDARNKLEYWLNFKEQMFTKLIKEAEIHEIIKNKRTFADVDINTRNVDYIKKDKKDNKVSKEIVHRPKISKKEKKINKALRKQEQLDIERAIKERKQKENDLIDYYISNSEKMKAFADREFIENGGIIVTELIKELGKDPLKKSVVFENGSRITAQATSAEALTSLTVNLLFLDEFAKVPAHVAEEFITSTYPVISSGQSCKIIMVSTPKGMNQFYEFWMKAIRKENANNFYPIRVGWWEVPGRDDAWKEEMIADIGIVRFSQEFSCVCDKTIIIIRDRITNLIKKVKIEDFFKR